MPRKTSARETKKSKESKESQDFQVHQASQEIPDTGRKLKPETWISMLNLILVTLGGIILTFYLNIRNEEFQKQYLDLQSKTELANITTSYNNGVVSIKNFGPATAQNLRLVICITSVASKWTNVINDATNLDISIDNPAVESTTQIKSVNCGSRVGENNSTHITVKSLPPEQSIKLKIAPSNEIILKNINAQIDVYIISSDLDQFLDSPNNPPSPTKTKKPQSTGIPTSTPNPQVVNEFTKSMFVSLPLNAALEDYLANSIFNIVNIEFSFACPNCNQDKKEFSLSSFIYKEINLIETDRSSNSTKIHLNTSSFVYLPEGEDFDSTQNLYLTEKINNENQISVIKSDKFEFPCNTPSTPSLFGSQNGQNLTLVWNSISGATRYEVFRSENGGALISIGTTNKTSLTDTLPSNTTYEYIVVASNACGKSEDSNFVTITR